MNAIETLRKMAELARVGGSHSLDVRDLVWETDWPALLAEVERLRADDAKCGTCDLCNKPVMESDQWHCDNPETDPIRHVECEIARLRAIVDKLPKTADGVPVVPWMRLFVPEFEGGVSEISVVGTWEKRSTSSLPLPVYHGERACYSTRSAAEAAARKEGKP